MDIRDIVEKCVVVGIDVVFLSLFYRLYKEESKTLKALESAQKLDLDHELAEKIRDSGGEIPYAVVSAEAKPLLVPLKSLHVPTIEGILRKNVIKEYKATWIPFLRMWSTTDYTAKESLQYVPFGLYGRIGRMSFFKKPACIELVDPLLAHGLVLTEVHKNFKVPEGSLAEDLIGLILREQTVGIQEIEYMLLDNSTLTAVGKLVVKDDVMKMMPPDNGLTYYLTPGNYNELVKALKTNVRIYKSLTVVMCVLSSFLLGFLFKKGYQELKRRVDMARDLKRRLEARKAIREGVDENAPKCVVCIENPVEVIVLECGHACLCLNCSEERFEFCPVCRGRVDRLVPVYMP